MANLIDNLDQGRNGLGFIHAAKYEKRALKSFDFISAMLGQKVSSLRMRQPALSRRRDIKAFHTTPSKRGYPQPQLNVSKVSVSIVLNLKRFRRLRRIERNQ